MRNHSLRFLLGVFSLVSFAGCDSISQPSIDWSSYLAGEYYKTPSELEKEVDNNEVAFERKYKNKIIYVSGWVRNIDKDSFQVANRYYFYNDLAGISVEQVATIHCSVREESRRYIPELNSREAVVAVGRVDYSGGGVFDTIVLDDCIWGDKNNADTIGGAKLDIKNSKTFAHYNQILKAEHNKKLMDKRKKELEHEENVRVYDQSINREIRLSTNAIQKNPILPRRFQSLYEEWEQTFVITCKFLTASTYSPHLIATKECLKPLCSVCCLPFITTNSKYCFSLQGSVSTSK